MRQESSTPSHAPTGGYALSLALSLILNSILLVAKETNPGLKAWMRDISGHHWITHAAAVVFTYAVLGVVLSRLSTIRRMSLCALLVVTAASIILQAAIILGYYLTHI